MKSLKVIIAFKLNYIVFILKAHLILELASIYVHRSGDGDDDDDIAKLGVRTVVVSEGNEEVDEDALNSNLSDYKRGKRLKKLVRLLGSAQVKDDPMS